MMKINLEKKIGGESALIHLVMHCLTETIIDEIKGKTNYDNDGMVDLCLTINGHELNVEKFMENWQSQVSGMILEEANDLIHDKCVNLSDLIYDVTEAVKEKTEELLKERYGQYENR